jgi:hypothetical protein
MRWTQQRRREAVSQGESLVSDQPARRTNGAFSVRQNRMLVQRVRQRERQATASHQEIVRHMGNDSAPRMVRNDTGMVG